MVEEVARFFDLRAGGQVQAAEIPPGEVLGAALMPFHAAPQLQQAVMCRSCPAAVRPCRRPPMGNDIMTIHVALLPGGQAYCPLAC